MLPPLSIHSPGTLSEAVEILNRWGSDAALYAGGTELIVLLKYRLATYEHLIDLKSIPELQTIEVEDERASIGAVATYQQLRRHFDLRNRWGELVELVEQTANPRVWAAGTLGGNLSFADPHSDPATLLIGWGAELELTGVDGTRRVPVEDFIHGPMQTDLRHSEILTRIILARRQGRASSTGFRRFSTLERPTANAAVNLQTDESGCVQRAAVVVGAVGPTPARVVDAEALIAGAAVGELAGRTDQLAGVVSERVEPIEDNYGSVDYKRHLAGELTRRALLEALAKLGNGGSHT
jgi:carbon-monoxide dehydrogenase medium subunit